jgi:hypothetical protein
MDYWLNLWLTVQGGIKSLRMTLKEKQAATLILHLDRPDR